MIAAVLAAASLALVPGGDSQSFESVSSLPKGWSTIQYHAGVSKISIESGDASDGSKYLELAAPSENHTRVLIPATVETGATYKFSAMVRGTGNAPVPALLALDGDASDTTKPIPADGQWHPETLYVRSSKATTVNLVLSLGWFGNTVAGTADFDSVKLEKVDNPPAGTVVATIGAAATSAPQQQDDSGSKAKPKPPSNADESGWIIPLVIVMVLLAGGIGFVLARREDEDDAEAETKDSADTDTTADDTKGDDD